MEGLLVWSIQCAAACARNTLHPRALWRYGDTGIIVVMSRLCDFPRLLPVRHLPQLEYGPLTGPLLTRNISQQDAWRRTTLHLLLVRRWHRNSTCTEYNASRGLGQLLRFLGIHELASMIDQPRTDPTYDTYWGMGAPASSAVDEVHR